MSLREEIILDYQQASDLVLAHAHRLPRPSSLETVPINQALGRCLATAITADRDQPPFHRSTRDGYAVRSTDLQQQRSLRVIGQLRAGQPPLANAVQSGEAIEIMTGAPMPPGTDAVLMVEHADTLQPGIIRPHAGRSLAAGENVVPAGAEARKGSIVVPSGTRMAARHIGAAVSCGFAAVEVYRQPRIAILATGEELVEPGEPLLDHQIRNSNSYSLAAQVQRTGGLPIRLPIAGDSLDQLRHALDRAADADLMLISGGVSMGKYDFVEQALAAAGATFLFTGVRIQPGKPLVFGRYSAEKYFFGLPGNPVSTMVTFALFADPLIRALGGESAPRPLFACARLASPLQHKPGMTRFLPAVLEAAWDRVEVTAVPWQGSGDLAATARANSFIVVPPDQPELSAGEDVSVLLA